MLVNTMKASLLVLVLSSVSLIVCGCGGGSDKPQLGEVTGTVTMDGKPVYGVAVVFSPDKGRPARGSTDLNGQYELTYMPKTLGTKVGHNRVEILANEEGEEDSEEIASSGENTGPAPNSRASEKVRIPSRYNTKSELEAEVKPGKNVFDFKLESKPAK